MSCPAFWYRTFYLGLSPVRSCEIVDNDVGEIFPMLVLAAVDQQLRTLPKAGGMT